MPNTYLPIGLSLKNRRCLIVGGGHIALRKIEAMLDYDCRITVIAPETVEKIDYFAEAGRLTLAKRAYRSPEAKKFGIVIAACDDRKVNKKIAADCEKAGVPINVVDDPELCGFIFPAIVQRDNLTVSVSTDGKSPFLAGHLRLILEDIFPERWKKIAGAAAQFRSMVRQRWPKSPKEQTACYKRFVEADWKTVLKDKKDAGELEDVLVDLLSE
ncbi:MAG: bifunctional precorrin-2 dehydrogenase/sirohydrochlorin ferrochelatase [Elusimicrobiota bacterium]